MNFILPVIDHHVGIEVVKRQLIDSQCTSWPITQTFSTPRKIVDARQEHKRNHLRHLVHEFRHCSDEVACTVNHHPHTVLTHRTNLYLSEVIVDVMTTTRVGLCPRNFRPVLDRLVYHSPQTVPIDTPGKYILHLPGFMVGTAMPMLLPGVIKLLLANDAICIVNEDRHPRQHIVRVEVGDGEVVDALVASGPVFGGSDLHVGAGAGAEPHAGFEVCGLDPGVDVAGDPERVGIGGDDHPLLAANCRWPSTIPVWVVAGGCGRLPSGRRVPRTVLPSTASLGDRRRWLHRRR